MRKNTLPHLEKCLQNFSGNALRVAETLVFIGSGGWINKKKYTLQNAMALEEKFMCLRAENYPRLIVELDSQR